MKVAPGEKPRNTNQQQSEESSQPALDPITGLCNQSELHSGLCKSIRWPAAHSWPRDQSQCHNSPTQIATWCTPPLSAEGPRSPSASVLHQMLSQQRVTCAAVLARLAPPRSVLPSRLCPIDQKTASPSWSRLLSITGGHAPFSLTRRGRICGLCIQVKVETPVLPPREYWETKLSDLMMIM